MRGDKVFSQCAPRPRPPGFDVLYQAFGLSSRMTTAVALACNGLEAKEIAARMGVSESAVKKQFRSASLRIGTRGRGHLCAVCSVLAVGLSRAEAEAVLATRVAAT